MSLRGPTDYTKLDPEVKAKWLAALRSGHFTQARKTLRGDSDTDLCCIGVGYCAAMAAPIHSIMVYEDGDEIVADHTDVAGDSFNLDRRASGALIEMNDEKGYDFDEIADWIDANL